MKALWCVMVLLIAVSVVGLGQDPVLDRLDDLAIEIDGLTLSVGQISADLADVHAAVGFVTSQATGLWAALNDGFDAMSDHFATIESALWPTIAKIDDLKTNVDFVGSQVISVGASMNDGFDAMSDHFATIESALWPTIATIDGLKTNVEFVGMQISDLGQQLSTEHDELADAINDGVSGIVDLILDFGPALANMNQNQITLLEDMWYDLATSCDSMQASIDDQLSGLHDLMGQEFGFVHDAIWQASSDNLHGTWNAADYVTNQFTTQLSALDARITDVENTLSAMDAKLDQLMTCCDSISQQGGDLDYVIQLLEYLVDTLPPGWDHKATH